MRPWVPCIILLFLLPALAGCTDPEGEGPEETPSPSATPSPTTEPTPDRSAKMREAGRYVPWDLSDFWVYEMDVRGLAEDEETQLVYYEESGPEYVVGAPTYAQALHHAVFSVNPILGRIHKGHLAPHERGEHAEMFPFEDGHIPHGKKWATVFYGRQLSLEARHDPAIPTPDGPQPGYRINGTDADGSFRITYSYVPTVKWFADLTATDADGTVIDLQLKDHDTGYSGPAHFIRAKDLFDETIQGSVVPETRTFAIEEDLVERKRVGGFAVHADVRLTDGVYAQLVLKDPEGNEIWRKTHQDEAGIDEIWPEGEKPEGPVEERPQWPAGTYTFEFLGVGGSEAEVLLVGTQDNSGSV